MSATLTTAAGQRNYPTVGKLFPFLTPSQTGTTDGANGHDVKPAKNDFVQSSPREYAYRLSAFLLGGDFIAACVAIFAGLELREWQRLGSLFTDANWVLLVSHVPFWALAGGGLFMWLMVAAKTYEVANIYRMQRWLKSLLQSVGLWSMAVWACIGLFQITEYAPRLGVVYCALALVVLLTLWRLAAFVFLVQPRWKEAASSRIIIVGWNEKAAHLRLAIRRDLGQLSEIIGCVPLPGTGFASKPPPEVAVLGDYESLPTLAAHCRASTIILADVSCSAWQIQELIKFCQREMIGFQLIPEYFPSLNSGLQIQVVSGVPLLGVNQLPLDRTINRMIKRALDLVGGFIGLVLTAPIILFFGILVYLESPGPVIFPQRRTSRSGRVFMIYKIRSMRMNAEAESGAVWCTRDDPRRLKIGTFMRKYNIDELPQFWNVIKGDMSLVGPRPERPELIEKFKDQIPSYNARHEVRTGLTGWAQIHGWRGDTDLTKRIEADLYYLENWSVFLDFCCIVATIFNNKNAH
jgi:exopolysaccharide biosynthesis polyprenyl glycosylphosphotransferase